MLDAFLRSKTPEESYKNRYVIAVIVTFAAMVELIDFSIVFVAIPAIKQSLGATVDEVAWITIAFVIAHVTVIPLSGWLANCFGRRRYYSASILLFIVASFGCGQSNSIEALCVWRFFQGLAGGGLLATSQSILLEVFPREQIGKSTAIFGFGMMLGPMLGPTVGGYLTELLSWHWVFYVNLPIGAAVLIATILYVPDSVHRVKVRRVDWLGLLMLVLGVSGLQYVIETGRPDWFASSQIIVVSVISVLCLFGFVLRQLNTDTPILDVRMLTHTQFASSLLLVFFAGAAMFSGLFIFPVYLESVHGYTPMDIGLIVLVSALAGAIAMGISPKLARIDPRLMVLFGMLMFMWSMVEHSLFTPATTRAEMIWPLILRGFGLGVIWVPLKNLAISRLEIAQMPQAMSYYNLSRQLGGGIGIAISVTLLLSMKTQYLQSLLMESGLYSLDLVSQLSGMQDALSERTQEASLLSTMPPLVTEVLLPQAKNQAYEHVFLFTGIALLLTAPALLLMKHTPKTS